jgi:hypothetical protein
MSNTDNSSLPVDEPYRSQRIRARKLHDLCEQEDKDKEALLNQENARYKAAIKGNKEAG